ncbi:hypothetical protein BUALT_Bualt15G0064300 [Buddleja alternifolia]|uniref:Uncharacterized protein n=1 Tax=Buddleja alternifolia TaxID=168488 RepID=A0AAV6WNP3_9LAMI|nr:hypothetical protein BUALT_Bualt15G0064300 [Buddleja alternifolia]
MASKLRESVTFLPLKDLRYSSKTLQGHTWFMSSMHDTHEKGEVQYQEFPSKASKGRLLCLKGADKHDGSWNSYALAWAQALPPNATLMKGLTFTENESTSSPACFEKAVVMRHNEGGMSREKRVEVYDLLRCKARVYCNVSLRGRIGEFDEKGFPVIGLTMFMRTGPRSFKNESTVIGIFDRACRKVEGCRLMVAYANNLSFCEQVSEADEFNGYIGVSTRCSTDQHVPNGQKQQRHGILSKGLAQARRYRPIRIPLDRQLVRDEPPWRLAGHRRRYLPLPENDRRCMSVYKNARIGYNDTYFSEWAKNVLNDVIMLRKAQEMSTKTELLMYQVFRVVAKFL